MSRSRDDANLSTGGEPTDAGRAERVAQIDGFIDALFGLARAADEGKWDTAEHIVGELGSRAKTLKEAVQREARQSKRDAEAVREGQRGSEEVHGKAARDA